MVKAFRASSRVTFCSGYQPPSGSPARVMRVTPAYRPWKGLTFSTGASEPPMMMLPASSTVRQA